MATSSNKNKQVSQREQKKKSFALAYLKHDFNGTQAAIEIGHKPSAAAQAAWRYLQDDDVQQHLKVFMQSRIDRLEIDADYVLDRNTQIDQLDVIDLFDDNLNLRDLRQIPIEWRRTITGIEVKETVENDDETTRVTVIKKIKWPDKLKNLELIGRHVAVGAFDETLNIKGELTLTEVRRTIVDPAKKGA